MKYLYRSHVPPNPGYSSSRNVKIIIEVFKLKDEISETTLII